MWQLDSHHVWCGANDDVRIHRGLYFTFLILRLWYGDDGGFTQRDASFATGETSSTLGIYWMATNVPVICPGPRVYLLPLFVMCVCVYTVEWLCAFSCRRCLNICSIVFWLTLNINCVIIWLRVFSMCFFVIITVSYNWAPIVNRPLVARESLLRVVVHFCFCIRPINLTRFTNNNNNNNNNNIRLLELGFVLLSVAQALYFYLHQPKLGGTRPAPRACVLHYVS